MMRRSLSLLLCLAVLLSVAAPAVQASGSNVYTSDNIMDNIVIEGDSTANIVIDGNEIGTPGETKLPNPSDLITESTNSTVAPLAPVEEYQCKCVDLASAVEHVGVCDVKMPYIQLCDQSAEELYAQWGSYNLEEQTFLMSYLYEKFPLKQIELQKLLDAPTGVASEVLTDGTTVSVQGIPQDGSLTVGETTDEVKDIVDTYVADNEEASTELFSYDVSVQDGAGADWQPETSVKMELELPGAKLHKYTKVYVVHVDDEGNASTIEATVTEDGKIAFETPGFSAFYGFTVDFDYEGVQFSIPGMSSIKLSELFENLKMPLNAEDVVNVQYTDDTQIKIEQLEGDWLLTSLKAFTTEEKLTLTMADGTVYQIKVTDVVTGDKASFYMTYQEGSFYKYIDGGGTGAADGVVTLYLDNTNYPTGDANDYVGEWWTQPLVVDGNANNATKGTLEIVLEKKSSYTGTNCILPWLSMRIQDGARVIIRLGNSFGSNDTITIKRSKQWINNYKERAMFDIRNGDLYFNLRDSDDIAAATVSTGAVVKSEINRKIILDGNNASNTTGMTRQAAIIYCGYASNSVIMNNVIFRNNNFRGIYILSNDLKKLSIRNAEFESTVKYINGGGGAVRIEERTVNDSYNSDVGGFDGGEDRDELVLVRDVDFINVKFNQNSTGTTSGSGGAFSCTGNLDDTNFTDCQFLTCTAYSQGGAVYIGDGQEAFNVNDIYFTNCKFTSCSTTDSYGGAVCIKDKFGTLQFEGCTFSSNTGKTHAGAINISDGDNGVQAWDVNFIKCTFTNNTATGNRGGAIRMVLKQYITSTNETHDPTVSIQGCTFSGHTAGSLGGVMSVKGQIDEFKITNKDSQRSSFTNNSSGSRGGAIAMNCTKVTNLIIENTDFVGNSSGSLGGTIEIGYALAENEAATTVDVGAVSVSGCTFKNSRAQNVGGALLCTDGKYGSISIQNTSFENCVSPRYGGAICMKTYEDNQPFSVTGNVSVIGCSFKDCHTGYLTCDTFTDKTQSTPKTWDHDEDPYTDEIDKLNGVGGGGAICLGGTVGGRVIIKGASSTNYTLIENGTSWNNAGAIHFTNDMVINGVDPENPNEPAVDLQYLNINKCFARDAGFAIYIGQVFMPSLKMRNCTIQNCGFFDLTNPEFPRYNVFPADNGTLDNVWYITPTIYKDSGKKDADGNKIYVKDDTATTAAVSTFRTKWKAYSHADLCRSSDTGGTFRTIGNTSCIAEISDCEFLNNKTYSNGAGVYWNSLETFMLNGEKKSPALTLIRTVFDGNTAYRDGGAIYCEASITVQSCEFKNNVATNRGGAIAQQIYNNGERPLGQSGDDEKNQITLTYAPVAEGGTRVPTKLHHNQANHGGAISITVAKTDSVTDGDPKLYRMEFILNGAHVYQNVASGNGGGIYYSTETYTNEDEQTEVDYFKKMVDLDNGLIWGNVSGGAATQVTDGSTLKVGDQLVIAALDENMALGTTQNTSDRAESSVIKHNPEDLIFDANTQIITLVDSSVDGAFAFQVANGVYLGATGHSATNTDRENQLNDVTTIDANSSWKISINGGVATIQSQGDVDRNTIRFNNNQTKSTDPSTGWFNAYASTSSVGASLRHIAVYRVKSIGNGHGIASLVTDATGLKAGDSIIIKAIEYEHTLSIVHDTNIRLLANVEYRANQHLTFGEDTQIITLVDGNQAGTFALQVAEDLYLGTGTGDQSSEMTNVAYSNATSAWTITIDALTGKAMIVSQSSVRNTMRYNLGNASGPWFNTYTPTNTQHDIVVYKVNSKDGSYRTATLVTNDGHLKAGDKIIIVAKDHLRAMGTTYSNTTRKTALVTKHKSLDMSKDTQVVTLVPGSTDGTFALQTESGKYLTAATNKLTTGTTVDANSSWAITVDAATGKATMVANSLVIRHSAANDLFSSHNSDTVSSNVTLYRLGIETPDGYGGGIYMNSNQVDTSASAGYSKVEISGGEIYKNIAYGGNGGGVYLTGENALCTINGETTTVGVVIDDTTDLTADDGNQAIGEQIAEGQYEGGNGGGIAIFGGARIEMTGGFVSNNVASVAGGGIAVHGSTMYFEKGTVQKNKAVYGAGVSVMNGGDVSTVTGANPVWGMEFIDGTIADNIASAIGGGICLSNKSTMKLSGGNVLRNYAATATTSGETTTYSYAEGQWGGGIAVSQSSYMDIYSGKVDENHSYNGGGIGISGNSEVKMKYKTGTTEGGSVSSNTAAKNGGGIWLNDSDSKEKQNKITITGGIIDDNTAESVGGGIHIDRYGYLELNDGVISNNEASEYGGGLSSIRYSSPGSPTYSTILLKGGEVSGNTAQKNGGGVYAYNYVHLTITGTEVTGNTATAENGGGIYFIYYGDFKISGGEVSGNKALNGVGGGIYLAYLSANADISGGDIFDNQAKDGAGLYISGYKSRVVTITGSPNIYNNTASGNGGGIFTKSAAVIDMQGGSIHNNIASGDGGGIYASDSSSITIKTGVLKDENGNTIKDAQGNDIITYGKIDGNTGKNGGGVYVTGGATLTVTDGHITNNIARSPSDAPSLETGHYSMAMNTLHGAGGGICVTNGVSDSKPSTFILTGEDIAIYGNKADFIGDDVFSNANQTQLNIPKLADMNLSGYDFDPVGWFEDYNNGDSWYLTGLNMLTKNNGSVGDGNSGVFRYRQASADVRLKMLITPTYVSASGVNKAGAYVAMTLGIPAAVDDTVIIDYGSKVTINVWKNDLFISDTHFANTKDGSNNVVYNSYIGKTFPEDAKYQDGVYYSSGKNGALPVANVIPGTDPVEYDRYTDSCEGFYGIAVNGDSNGDKNGLMSFTPNTINFESEGKFYYVVRYGDYWYYAGVNVIPATTVYFEDNVDSVKYHTQADSQHDILVDWVEVKDDKATVPGDQAQDRPGVSDILASLDANNIYGYDESYANSTTYSGGSIHMVTVSRIDKENTRNARATFSFTGTGFDILSLCSPGTGLVFVSVYEGTEGIVYDDDPDTDEWEPTDPLVSYMVDTYYAAGDTLYQVPVIKTDMNKVQKRDPVTGQKINEYWGYGTYTVELYIAPSFKYTEHAYNQAEFYLDAIRIYNPMGNGGEKSENAYNAYIADGEYWPVYQELRNMFLTQQDIESEAETNGMIFIDQLKDTTGKYTQPTIKEYKTWGPNNEIYLNGQVTEKIDGQNVTTPGQAVGFKLNALKYAQQFTSTEFSEEVVQSIQIAMRCLTGTGSVKISGNGKTPITKTLGTTEMYYDITDLMNTDVTIENTGTTPIAITTIKVTHKSAPTELIDMSDLTTVDGETKAFALTVLTPKDLTDPTVAPKRPALSFNGMVCYNVFFTAEDLGDLTAADLGLAVFNTEVTDGTVENADEVHLGATEIDGEYMVATNGVHAKYLGDTKYFRAFAKKADGSYVYSKMVSYSAVDYAMNTLAKSNDVALKQLVVAMLNYGAEAQKFFLYKTDDLMNKDLTADHQALLTGFNANSLNSVGKVDASKVGMFASTGGFTKRAPAISFKGTFEINYFMTPAHPVDGDMMMFFWNEDTYNAATELTPGNADKVVAMTLENGTYTASSDEIAAKYLDQTIYVAAVYESNGVTYCSGVLPYSIAAYCQNPPATVQNLATAAAIYGCTAKQFFGAY